MHCQQYRCLRCPGLLATIATTAAQHAADISADADADSRALCAQAGSYIDAAGSVTCLATRATESANSAKT